MKYPGNHTHTIVEVCFYSHSHHLGRQADSTFQLVAKRAILSSSFLYHPIMEKRPLVKCHLTKVFCKLTFADLI